MRIVKHLDNAHKVLYHFPSFQEYDDCPERIVCLSERDMQLILNSIQYANQFQTRVWTDRNREEYTIATSEEFEQFQEWIATLYTNLGGWLMCNEQLERIATALEGIQTSQAYMAENTYEKVTWQDVLDDLESTLGIGNVIYLVLKEITDLIPSLRIKLNGNELIRDFWHLMTFTRPLMTMMAGINASLAAIATATATEKIVGTMEAVTSAFGALNTYYTAFRSALLGDFSLLDDIVRPIWDWFIPDNEGGAGGDDPDTDPENRIGVMVNNNLINAFDVINNININNQGCCNLSGDDDIETVLDGPTVTEPDRETEDPPGGYPDWETYDEDKCLRVNLYLDSFIDTLNNWGGLSGFVGGLTIAIIVGVTLLTIPPVGLTLLLAALAGILTINSAHFAFFITMADYFTDNRDDIVCDLMDAQDTITAYGIMVDYIEAAIASLVGASAVASYLQTASETLLYNVAIGGIYDGSMTIPEGYTATCDCEEPCATLRYDFNTDLEGWSMAGSDCAGNAATGSRTLTWLGGGHMRHQCTIAGAGLRVIISQRSSLSQVLSATSVLKIAGNTNNGASVFVVPRLVTNAGCRSLTSTSYPLSPITERTWSLAAYAGETVSSIQIYVNNSVNQNIDLNINYVEISC